MEEESVQLGPYVGWKEKQGVLCKMNEVDARGTAA
jgi:hypothetical protein